MQISTISLATVYVLIFLCLKVQGVSAVFRKLGFSMLSAWQKPLKIVSGFPDGWSAPQRGSSAVISVLEMRFWSVFS